MSYSWLQIRTGLVSQGFVPSLKKKLSDCLRYEHHYQGWTKRSQENSSLSFLMTISFLSVCHYTVLLSEGCQKVNTLPLSFIPDFLKTRLQISIWRGANFNLLQNFSSACVTEQAKLLLPKCNKIPSTRIWKFFPLGRSQTKLFQKLFQSQHLAGIEQENTVSPLRFRRHCCDL